MNSKPMNEEPHIPFGKNADDKEVHAENPDQWNPPQETLDKLEEVFNSVPHKLEDIKPEAAWPFFEGQAEPQVCKNDSCGRCGSACKATAEDKPQEDEPVSKEFVSELKKLINQFSVENDSNTPDHILAEYLDGCLANFAVATQARETWYGRPNFRLKYSYPVSQVTYDFK